MDKVLVITGGSRGIGLATAERFADKGYCVINLSRQQPALTGITHITADLSDINWPSRCGDALLEQLNGAEAITLVHNAGVLAKDTVRDIEAETFQRVMQLNVIAASQLNQLLLPVMNTGSSILYVSSTLGEKGVANTCSYVSSKHAQIGLMKAGCQDLFGSGIHSAAICPGFTDTEMLRDHVGNDAEVLAYFAGLSAFGRLLAPKEIADTLWFCANTPAINGSVIHANLGQLEN
ncbi:SDR family NAD(P)-dependent oxidoreductase [Oceanicoccus sagamiensis]|uniref:Short-chain dehydrogenase n=1 Tax=Oceanicoccus sagamiensis TaxID=716816 RepID=A0A1X9N9V4_9GAMM|nr:SDR family oxidoreductase [Oceanicoccus sagamiensis]ARN73961.1 short-chain dehydrogenase [Oceanicoccus sagamiensis]